MSPFDIQAQLLQLAERLSSSEAKQHMHNRVTTAVDQASIIPNVKSHLPMKGQRLVASLADIGRLEQLSGAAHDRELDSRRAVAVLCGSRMRYFMKSSAVDLGRSTNSLGKVFRDHFFVTETHTDHTMC